MSIRFRCPQCGKDHASADGMEGKKVACASCGQPMRIPVAPAATAAGPAPEPSGTIRFRCPACGKSYATPAGLAGKKIRCKSCGGGVRVPGGPAPSLAPASTATAPSPAAPERARKVTTPPSTPPPPPAPSVDIYGLDEAPMPARAAAGGAPGRGDDSDLLAPARPGPVADETALPPRAGASAPLSAAQKKKIQKRADKLEKTRPSFAGAGMGVSFGTILAITLFGWRLYRISQKFNPANRVVALGGEDEVVARAPLDPKTAAEDDSIIEASLKGGGSAEARDWLDPAKHPDHALMEIDAAEARAMVAGFYERGAVKVWVVDHTTVGDAVLAAEVAVELPKDPAQRKKCFAWEVKYLQGEDPTPDVGQRYLSFTTD